MEKECKQAKIEYETLNAIFSECSFIESRNEFYKNRHVSGCSRDRHMIMGSN